MTMSRNRVQTLLVTLALAAVAWYYQRREQTIRESLTLSQQWAGRDDGHTPASVTATDPSALERAAAALNARPEEVPERVEALDAKVRDLTGALEKNRTKWVARWWEARRAEPPVADEPHVTVIDLPDGTLEDAEALAKQALSDDLGLTIVTAGGDGTLAVAVGSGLDQRADEIAREIAAGADGGAGGGAEFATGGGEAAQLAEAAAATRDRLQSEAGFAV